jgi:orotate phosphoribosyltransferase
VTIVDDLLTTGSSIRQVVRLIEEYGGIVVGAAVVVRRSPNVIAEDCNVPELGVLAEAPPGFAAYDPEDCPLCASKVPVVLRPGHGHEWIKEHPGYPTV